MSMTYNECWTYPKSKIDDMFKEMEEKINSVLPTYAKTDNGKVLKVDGTGDEAVLVWGTDAT